MVSVAVAPMPSVTVSTMVSTPVSNMLSSISMNMWPDASVGLQSAMLIACSVLLSLQDSEVAGWFTSKALISNVIGRIASYLRPESGERMWAVGGVLLGS